MKWEKEKVSTAVRGFKTQREGGGGRESKNETATMVLNLL